MQATKDHISLATAQLLKECGAESKYIFQQSLAGCYDGSGYEKEGGVCFLPKEKAQLKLKYSYPAYTWQEILWENPYKFFGEIKYFISEGKDCDGEPEIRIDKNCSFRITTTLLMLIQQKKYQEADEYFRKHCILINPPIK